jgi:hypothetical protein
MLLEWYKEAGFNTSILKATVMQIVDISNLVVAASSQNNGGLSRLTNRDI